MSSDAEHKETLTQGNAKGKRKGGQQQGPRGSPKVRAMVAKCRKEEGKERRNRQPPGKGVENHILSAFVLVLAEMELVFLPAAGVVLCFGFGMRTMPMLSCCRAVLTVSRGLFCLSYHPAGEELGGDKARTGIFSPILSLIQGGGGCAVWC